MKKPKGKPGRPPKNKTVPPPPRPSFYWYQNTPAVKRAVMGALKKARFASTAENVAYDEATERWRVMGAVHLFAIEAHPVHRDEISLVVVATMLPTPSADRAADALRGAQSAFENARTALQTALLHLTRLPGFPPKTIASLRAVRGQIPRSALFETAHELLRKMPP